MAVHVLLRGRRIFCSQPVRWYAKNYKMPKEEVIAYRQFRKEMTAHRRKYMDECLEQSKQEVESKVERDKLEREIDQERCENLSEEDNIMKEKKKILLDTNVKEMSEKMERGNMIRLEKEMKVKTLHRQEICNKSVEMQEFITFENLDDKINEAINNMQTLTFALERSGRKASCREDIYHSDYN